MKPGWEKHADKGRKIIGIHGDAFCFTNGRFAVITGHSRIEHTFAISNQSWERLMPFVTPGGSITAYGKDSYVVLITYDKDGNPMSALSAEASAAPEYKRVIPDPATLTKKIVIPAKVLSVMKKITGYAKGDMIITKAGVSLKTANGSCVLSSQSYDDLPDGDGFGINPAYFVYLAQFTDGDVEIKLHDCISPVAISTNTLGVEIILMPVRL
jgi:hypothetical protein